VRLHR
jgi:hypothetical protein